MKKSNKKMSHEFKEEIYKKSFLSKILEILMISVVENDLILYIRMKKQLKNDFFLFFYF